MIRGIEDDLEKLGELFSMQQERDLVEEQAQMEPYVLNLRNPWDDEMHTRLEDPAPHQVYWYNRAIKNLAEELGIEDHELIPDGGSRTQYYWSGEDGVLYHTEKGEDMVVPFFDTVDQAEQFLQRQADQHGKERYSGLVLRKTGNQKVEEATDVLTEQSGLTDYVADGGTNSQEDDFLEQYYEEALEEYERPIKPFWDAQRGKEADYRLFDYAPLFHYDKGQDRMRRVAEEIGSKEG